METLSNLYNVLIQTIESNINLKLDLYKKLSDDKKKEHCISFCELLKNDDLYTLFLNKKIKLFSSKTVETFNISKSLFNDDLLLKSIFNNQEIKIKNLLWCSLFNMYILYEKIQTIPNMERVENLNNIVLLMDKNLTKNVKENILNVNVNEQTDNMLDDIVGSFQDLINDNKNPFENIMKITNNITTKYSEKLENGDIELDKVISSIQTSLPNIGNMMNKEEEKEKVVIDENFSTADVPLGEEKEKKIMNLSNVMGAVNSVPNMSGLLNMVNKMDKINTDEEVEDLKEEMNQYLEKDLGLNIDEFKEDLNKVEKQYEKLNLKNKLVEE